MASDTVAPPSGFFPWQETFARQWLQHRERFGHAWLLTGLSGIGKRHFARAAAASLLCEAPQAGLACRQCASCHWYEQGNHPDFRIVRPDAMALAEGAFEGSVDEPARGTTPSREIRIEQIRQLESWVHTATHRGGLRVIVLYPVQAINTYAANALLKMLEEPPENSVFLLVTDAPDRVLPTVRSRCRRLPLPAPDGQAAGVWLQQKGVSEPSDYLAAAGGAPLAALEQFEQAGAAWPAWMDTWLAGLDRARGKAMAARLAGELDKAGTAQWLPVMQKALHDIQRLQNQLPPRYYPALGKLMQEIASRSAPVATANLLQYLARQVPVANHPLNGRLLAHDILLRTVDILR